MRPLLAALALLVSGCVAVPTTVDPSAAAGAPQAVLDALAGVPCEVDAVGEGTSENLKELSLTPFDESLHAEIDARGDLLLNARYQLGGFEVVNISDPLAPRHVATYEGEEKTALDVKWMPSGDAAVIGNPDGVQLVDLRDPLQPVLAHKILLKDHGLSGTAHMVFAARLADEEWVFVASGANSGVYILKREGWELAFQSVYKHPVLTGGPLAPHDMTVLHDEILQKPVLYIANGFQGWLAADVTDPANPKHLGGFVNPDPAQGYTHTIQAEKIGERRIVATVQEVGVNAVKVWDATDLAKPVLLGFWFADKTQPVLPNHNLQVLDGRLYVAHYGKGVYVFDLTKLGDTPYADTLTLQPVARFAPADPQSTGNPALDFVNVWDVIVHRGVVYVSDMDAGVHAVGYGCLAPGDARQTSRG